MHSVGSDSECDVRMALLMSSLVVAVDSRITCNASRASSSRSVELEVFLAQLDVVHSGARGLGDAAQQGGALLGFGAGEAFAVGDVVEQHRESIVAEGRCY